MIEIPGILDRPMSRRHWTQMVGLGAASSLLNQSSAGAFHSTAADPIRACIFVMLYGGPSHIDTWDMKPHAPVEVRGEYQPISTSVPGSIICEHLPQCSQIMDRLAVIRSMHHNSASTSRKTTTTDPTGRPQYLLDDRDPIGEFV